jgi:hypothetical protein
VVSNWIFNKVVIVPAPAIKGKASGTIDAELASSSVDANT